MLRSLNGCRLLRIHLSATADTGNPRAPAAAPDDAPDETLSAFPASSRPPVKAARVPTVVTVHDPFAEHT